MTTTSATVRCTGSRLHRQASPTPNTWEYQR